VINMRASATKFVSSFLLGLFICGSVYADPIVNARTASRVDWVSAGISGTGGGAGTIALTGVTGTVSQAYLYWHGIDNGADGNYDNADITLNTNAVSGTAIGTSGTNCWGDGNSVAYRADVTAFVPGDGDYDLAGLSADTGHSSNGASLVVLFDDGDGGNNRDLVFFEGNDSSVSGFPGDDNGWSASLSPINYGGGAVGMEFHVADGQSFGDDTVTLSTPNGSLDIIDSSVLWDGNSLPTAGTSRTTSGELYDIHFFDITSAFGAVTGTVDLNLTGQLNPGDCHGLLLALVDLEPGSAPPTGPPEETVPVPALNAKTLALLAGLFLLIGLVTTRRFSLS
jgi:hypothetical protein